MISRTVLAAIAAPLLGGIAFADAPAAMRMRRHR